MKFILAKKLGMTTIYDDGIAKNVTLLEVGKNVVVSLKTNEKHGYVAIQYGLEKDKIDEKVKGQKRFSRICEARIENLDGISPSDEINLDQFVVGDIVKIVGITKGKGFQGPMKRHNFSGSPATHGHRHDHRAPGSIGGAFPERVFPGKRMAGRMGGQRATVKNVEVSLVDPSRKLLAVKGSVPGNRGTIVQLIQE